MSAVAGNAAERVQGAREYLIPALLVAILLMMIIPMPTFVVDLALAGSIGFSLCIFLAAIYVQTPLDLSVFPTMLLISTLARLAVDVATTRLILLHGGEGPDAAGGVIKTFGEFVVGGNYVVGVIVFLVLVVINFVVITKGSGRVAEVSARFVLDAMPGKQMAIDADLSSGAIGEQEARARRRQIQEEASFYGAMDGASKFVRGDAIAGLLITAINIVAGFVIGVTQQGLGASDAAATYTILTVGDGLVSQLPALLVSTAAGIVVTRSAGVSSLGPVMVEQIGRVSRSLRVAGVALAAMAFIPGLPVIPFVLLGGSLLLASRGARVEARPKEPSAQVDAKLSEKERLAALLPVDLLSLEVGFDLVPMVDVAQGGELTERIAGMRRSLVAEIGVIIPPIHVRDNLSLGSNRYRVLISGTEVGAGQIIAGRLLAIDPGTGGQLDGTRTTEPAFGLPAWWIAEKERARAEDQGFTVVDASTVMVTHVTEIIRKHAAVLLGRAEAEELFDVLARQNARLVEELIPGVLGATEVIVVLRLLLKEGVSIRDMRTIFETLSEYGGRTKEPQQLAEIVRQRLRRTITAKYVSEDGRIYGMLLDHSIENEIRQSSTDPTARIHGIDPRVGRKVLEHVERQAPEFGRSTAPPVLITSPDVRRPVADFIGPRIPGLSVLSYAEVTEGTEIVQLGSRTLPRADASR